MKSPELFGEKGSPAPFPAVVPSAVQLGSLVRREHMGKATRDGTRSRLKKSACWAALGNLSGPLTYIYYLAISPANRPRETVN